MVCGFGFVVSWGGRDEGVGRGNMRGIGMGIGMGGGGGMLWMWMVGIMGCG